MSSGVTSVEDGCTCGGMAACQQCQDRDAATPEPVTDDHARVIAEVLARFAGDLTRGILDRQDYGYYEGRDWAKGFLRDTAAAAVTAALSDAAAPDHDPTTSPEDQA